MAHISNTNLFANKNRTSSLQKQKLIEAVQQYKMRYILQLLHVINVLKFELQKC